MKHVTYFFCDNCGELFKKRTDCLTHEEGCLSLEEGQLVLFPLGLFRYEGRITEVHKAVLTGKEISDPYVYIETKEVVDGYEDLSQLHDGRHFVAPWNEIELSNTSSQENTA